MMKMEENEKPEEGETPEPEPAEEGETPDAPQETPAEKTAADLERELADAKEDLLRTLADMENLRARTQREQEQTRKFAITDFARAVLPVADNLHRAMESAPDPKGLSDPTLKSLVEGVAMTEKELLAILERYNIKRVEPLGEKFNHDLHQAMFEVPTADAAPGTVVEVMQTGYLLHDRLLRPAMVGVAKAAEGGESGSGGEPPRRVDTEA